MGYWDALEMVVVFEAGVAKLVRAWAHGAGGGGGLWGGARAGEGGVTFVGVAGRVVRGGGGVRVRRGVVRPRTHVLSYDFEGFALFGGGVAKDVRAWEDSTGA